jgi:hypothetical protein
MKLQLTVTSLRLRIDESELAVLQAGQTLELAPRHGGEALIALEVCVGESFAFAHQGPSWRLCIPGDALQQYVEGLPSRDPLGLRLEGEGGLRIDFDVDVRDSIAIRGARRRRPG